MSDSVLTSIEKLRRSTNELNKITDEAASLVQTVEAFLNKECSVGIDSVVHVSSNPVVDEEGAPNEDIYIGYLRHQGKYRIVVAAGLDIDLERTIKPWSEWNREIKLETIKKIPELVADIAIQVEQHIQKAKEENGKVAELLKAIQQKGGR